MARTALLLGGSGLVGRHVLTKLTLANAYGRVVSIGRRRIPWTHKKLEQVIVDLETLKAGDVRGPFDDVYCCLGTTIKTAGSPAAFRTVDFEYVLRAARIAQDAGAARFALISSNGASAGSRLFYSRTKGEAEQAIQQLGFAATIILRPSLLLGERNPPRPIEKAAELALWILTPLLIGPLRKYRAIAARDVAEAMVQAGAGEADGARVLESDEIQALADA